VNGYLEGGFLKMAKKFKMKNKNLFYGGIGIILISVILYLGPQFGLFSAFIPTHQQDAINFCEQADGVYNINLDYCDCPIDEYFEWSFLYEKVDPFFSQACTSRQFANNYCVTSGGEQNRLGQCVCDGKLQDGPCEGLSPEVVEGSSVQAQGLVANKYLLVVVLVGIGLLIIGKGDLL
jgi:hypothetical protein